MSDEYIFFFIRFFNPPPFLSLFFSVPGNLLISLVHGMSLL